ncbi:MAG: xanthine dehydrogenase family protein molybdopterin-binding subunit [Candidatus Eremiobacteraeota bacterium]|nr:xanthine dehydrogenase family protein molybdopterin-binding subunit [Candidatus Eremiobacteraeota bacterium]
MGNSLGVAQPRMDAGAKVTGATIFTADLAAGDALAGCVLRSPHPFARIRSIDVRRARAMPGVAAIAHAATVPDKYLDFGIKDQHLFAKTYARYAGEPVAAVAAQTQEQARAAADAIAIDYEVMEPVLDAEQALADDAPLVHPDWQTYQKSAGRVLRRNVCGFCRIKRGDVDAALASAGAVRVKSRYRFAPGIPGYIEPRAAIARKDADGSLTVWCGSQSPYSNRDDLAAFFDLDPARVRFINQFVGGAFGGKILMAAEWYAAALALQCDRAVRIAWSRREDGLHVYPRHGGYADFESAVSGNGSFLAMRATYVFDTGAYIGYGSGTALIATMLSSAPYRVPNIDLSASLVYTNKQIAGPVRAPGGPQANFAKESHVDELAAAAGVDPLDFRLKNAWRDGDVGPTGQKLTKVSVEETLRRAADAIGWGKPTVPNRGRGLCCTWWFSSCSQSKARVEIEADGRIRVVSGNPEVGTGSAAAALPIIAADVLGVAPQSVELVLADTATDTYDSGVGGSGSTYSAGQAVEAAALAAKDALLARAEDELEARKEDIELTDGHAAVRGAPDYRVSLAQLASGAPGGRIQTAGEAPTLSDPEFDASLVESHDFPTWMDPSFTTTAAEVDVDPQTGAVSVREIVTVQDVGFAINPTGVIGQIEGGAVQGLGFALSEELKYDDRGVVRAELGDYLMPTAVDAPRISTIVVESASLNGPHGMKGVGEPPVTTPAGAIANAIRSAVGVAPRETPMTPERVWRAVSARDGEADAQSAVPEGPR